MPTIPWTLSPDRCFGADPAQRAQARALYESVKDLPLVSPHGHVPPALLADPDARFGSYGRELAPLAGHYPAMLLGPPWWFFDSPLGMRCYFDQVIETAGLYNTAGFNDDTRAFASIPSRHDVWRRASCDWLAGMVVQGLLAEDEAHEMAHECAYGLAKRAYRVPETTYATR